MNGLLATSPLEFLFGFAALWAHLFAALLWGLYGYVTGVPLMPNRLAGSTA